MHKYICYTTRHRCGDIATSGTFGISSPGKYFDPDTIERLIRGKFTVEYTKSGSPTFVDAQGRQVKLYIFIDPLHTSIGQEALKAYLKECRRKEEKEEQQREEREEEIERLLSTLTHEEAVRRLQGDADQGRSVT